MFTNIGKKIKTLSALICWLGIIGNVIVAMIMIALGRDNSDILIAVGCIWLIVGPVLSWISSFFVYGYGELIDKTSAIEKSVCGGIGGSEKPVMREDAEDDRIAQLEKLRARDLITEEEYQQAISKNN